LGVDSSTSCRYRKLWHTRGCACHHYRPACVRLMVHRHSCAKMCQQAFVAGMHGCAWILSIVCHSIQRVPTADMSLLPVAYICRSISTSVCEVVHVTIIVAGCLPRHAAAHTSTQHACFQAWPEQCSAVRTGLYINVCVIYSHKVSPYQFVPQQLCNNMSCQWFSHTGDHAV